MEIFTLSTVLLFLGNIITVYLYSYMHRTFYEQRDWVQKRELLVPIIYVLEMFILTGLNLLEIPWVNTLSLALGYLVPLFIIYKVNHFRGIAYFLFYIVCIIIVELTISIAIGAITAENYSGTKYEMMTPQVSLMMSLAEALIVFVLCHFGNKDSNKKYDKITVFFMIIPLISLGIIVTDSVMMSTGALRSFDPMALMRVIILLFIMNIAMFITLEAYTRSVQKEMKLQEENNRLEIDSDLLELAAKSMRERLLLSEQVIQKDRLMRHDRRHFEGTILTLLEEGDADTAKRLLLERLEAEPTPALKYCDNATVNASVDYYIQKARKADINIEASLNIPQKLEVDELELAIAISNLLENAIHACEASQNKGYIKLTARYKSQLLIEIENYCEGIVELNEEGYPFSRESGHGVGTKSVLAFVNKTDSSIAYLSEENRFRVRMIINA